MSATRQQASDGSVLTRPAEPPDAGPANPGLQALAVLGFLALGAVYIRTGSLTSLGGRVAAEMVFVVPIALSVAVSAVAFRMSRDAERSFWLIGTALSAVLLVNELCYLGWVVIAAAPPAIYPPFVAIAASGGVLSFLALGALRRPSDRSVARRFRWSFDVAGAAVVVYVVGLRTWVQAAFTPVPQVPAWQPLVAAAYSTTGVMLLVGSGWTLLTAAARRRRRWERWMLVSFAIYAGGLAAWPMWYTAWFAGQPADLTRLLLDVVLVLGHYLFAISAAERILRRGQEWPASGSPGAVRGSAERVLAYAIVALNVVALPVLVRLAATAPEGGPLRVVYVVAATALCALMIGRTIAASVDNGRLFRESVTDPVTGLCDRGYFHQRLAIEVDRAQRYREPVSLLLADVDDHVAVVRAHGRSTGAELLRGVAGALRSEGGRAIASRLGPGHFGVVLPGVGQEAALAAALRILGAAHDLRLEGATPVGLSIGVATLPTHADRGAELLRVAQGALLWVKTHGKDQVLIYDPRTVVELTFEERLRGVETTTRLGTMKALAAIVDARQEATRSRSAEVGAVCALLARRLGLSEERVQLLETAAQMRDVGMIGLADSVLQKPGPLDDDEWAAVRRHPILAERIVGSTLPDRALGWLRHHHERWDGGGYPDGLRAVTIPLESRVLAVCDAWEAMTSERPWAPARGAEDAARELRACAGTQFDPAVVEVFVEIVDGGADAGAA